MNVRDLLPIPHLRCARNVLVVIPHPDDAELVAGGTIAALVKEGASVTYAVATDGGMGNFDPSKSTEEVGRIRRSEQEEAAEMLGVTEIYWLGFQDGFLPEIEAIRQKIVGVIRRVRPDFIMTLDPWLPYEAHPDHRKTAMAAVEAALYAQFPSAYVDDLRQGYVPHSVSGIALGLSTRHNTVINVTGTWQTKLDALRCHRSQFPEQVWNTFLPMVQAKAAEYGKEIGAEFGEAFKVLSPLHLHVMVDTWRL